MAGGLSQAARALVDDSAILPYLPRVIPRHLLDRETGAATIDGTLMFADVSGFTRLSERLARHGREGAEHLADAISDSFSQLLDVAYANGGSLLKFGGDALLLLFEDDDHAVRACRSALGMRRALREAGRIDTPSARVRLKMSVGIHRGPIELFLVGASHQELVVAGPAASHTVRMEQLAGPGEIMLSAAAASSLPRASLGVARADGTLLRRVPPGADDALPQSVFATADERLAGCLSTEVRAHVVAGPQPPEHRPVTVAFLRFGGTDALVAGEGPAAAAAAIGELLSIIQTAADEHEVCFLGSDVDVDGGKIILTAGAPRTVGDDEARVLLALRKILDARPRLPVRAGVHRGAVFAGDVGPAFRRTYTVMGDAVNVAARLMAAAPEGAIYASRSVLERSTSSFATSPLPPLTLKGKRQAVSACSVGRPVASAGHAATDTPPFIGRRAELARLEDLMAEAVAGGARLVQMVGEPGIGKSRLIGEFAACATGTRVLRARCEAYRASEPYAAWRSILVPLIGARGDAPPEQVIERLRDLVVDGHPDLVPWLALLAIPFGAEAPASLEVEQLAPAFRRPRLHEIVFRFLERELHGPTIIAIDEAHHLDSASADLLGAAAAALQDTPCLILLSGRHPQDIRDATAIELAPLPADDTVTLAEAATDHAPLPPHVVRRAAARSGGNPQFLLDLLAAGTDGSDLPEVAESSGIAEVDRLAPEDRQLVRRAAVLGDGFDDGQLAAVLEDVLATPDAATWRRLEPIIEQRDGRMWFRRATVREAAYQALSFRTRRRLHALAGRRLEQLLGPGASDAAGILSLHFARAGDHDRAWRYARIAAERAIEQAAADEAVVLYRRALAAAPNVEVAPTAVAEVWEALGSAYDLTGQRDKAARAFSSARRLLPEDAAAQGRLLHRVARLALDSGRPDIAARWVRRGLQAVGQEAGPRAARRSRAHLLATLAGIRQRQGRARQAIELCHRAIEEAQSARDPAALASACYVLDWALVESGRIAEATHSQRALRIYRRLGDTAREATVLNNLGAWAYFDGRWADAVELYEASVEASHRSGDELNAEEGNFNIAELRCDQGHLDDAETILRRSLRVWRAGEFDLFIAYALRQLGRVAVRDGRDEDAGRLFGAALETMRALRLEQEEVLTEALMAEADVAARRSRDALRSTDRLLALGTAASRAVPLLHRVRGCALAQLGRPDDAQAALGVAAELALTRGDHFERLLALDAQRALAACADTGETSANRRERRALTERMAIVELPDPAVTPERNRTSLPARAGREEIAGSPLGVSA